MEATLQIVTEAKLILLTTLQANKPRDKLLGARNSDSTWKASRPRR